MLNGREFANILSQSAFPPPPADSPFNDPFSTEDDDVSVLKTCDQCHVSISYHTAVPIERTTALALSRTQQLPREVTHSICRRALPTRYHSILSESLEIFKARVTVKPLRRREAGHLPVTLVIVRQAIRAMRPAMRRTLIPESTQGRERDL